MISITKEGSKEYPDIRINDGNKSFEIKRNGAPDLYWIPEYHILDDADDIIFTITDNDGDVYLLFERLYNNVISGNVFANNSKGITKEMKDNQQVAMRTGLVKDNVIYWHSEDYDPFESTAVLKIAKEDSNIKITFSKSKYNEEFPNNYPTYAVRISESPGMYHSFFNLFVLLHRQLQALDLTNYSDINHDNVISNKI